jgi:hypothetical protein
MILPDVVLRRRGLTPAHWRLDGVLLGEGEGHGLGNFSLAKCWQLAATSDFSSVRGLEQDVGGAQREAARLDVPDQQLRHEVSSPFAIRSARSARWRMCQRASCQPRTQRPTSRQAACGAGPRSGAAPERSVPLAQRGYTAIAI